jgi:hypothetical protein
MLSQKASIENAKNVRVLNSTLDEVNYDSKTNGVNRLMLYALRAQNLANRELKNVFTKAELSAIVDNENGTMIGIRYWGNKQMFLYSLEDGINLDGLDKKWGIKWETVKSKIEKLPDTVFLALHESIYRFWNEGAAFGSPAPNLENFINFYCNE